MAKKKRNKFTDALNEEMSTRKILKEAQVKSAEEKEKIFLAELTEEIIESEIKKSVPQEISVGKNIPPVEKVSLDKKSEPKKIVITRADFEKRVLAEADNDFYDDIRTRTDDKKDSPPVFHSKNFDRKPPEPEENISDEPDFDLSRKLSRPEMAGVTLSAIMMVYSITAMDKPLFFLALSLLTHLLRPLVGRLFGKHNRAVQNALKSFSWVIFFGAIILIFL